MRWAALTLAALLAGCGEQHSRSSAGPVADLPPLRLPRESPRSAAPPAAPNHTPGRRLELSVGLRLRRRGKRREEDDFLIKRIGASRDGERVVLTHIVGTSHHDDDERERRYAVSDILALNPDGGGTGLVHPATIMLWLREHAGIATDEDRDAAAWGRAEEQSHPELTQYESDEVLASGLRLPAWIDYVDGKGTQSRREITIVSMHGEEGEDPTVWRLEAYCHQRRDHRPFLLHGIEAVADRAEDLAPMDQDDIELWLRRKIGRETAHDTRRAEEMRNWQLEQDAADARAAERERRRNLAAGKEHAVLPQKAQVLYRRADGTEPEQGAEGFVIGFDTDPEGRATVLFFATRLDVKRGRALYIGEARDPENHLLVTLRSPPEASEPIADPAAWVAALPRDPNREIKPHG